MARLIGYIGSQAERLTCVLRRHRAALAREEEASDGWGVGFYQGEEILLLVQADTPAEAIAMRLFAEDADPGMFLFTPAEKQPEGELAPRILIRTRPRLVQPVGTQ